MELELRNKVKEAAKEYYKEQQNIANYTVEDYLKEINEN